MTLSKKEKKFWQHHYRIEKLKDIPQEMKGILSIDSDFDDDDVYFLTKRVPIIRSFDLENTQITDVGVQLICGVKAVEKLELKDARGITKNCLPFINALKDLKLLNLMKTSITLHDVLVLKDLQQLTALYLSSDKNEAASLEEIIEFKQLFPHCSLYLNYDLVG